MKRLSKLLTAALAVIMVFSLMVPAMAAAGVTANPSTTKLTVDGKAVDCTAYLIGGSNYFKLRDLATLLDGTNAQFEVEFDTAKKEVLLTTGKSYTPVGGEGSALAKATATASDWVLKVDGKAVDCAKYLIGGNNFFRLRDLSKALGFGVGYATDTNTALVVTSGPIEVTMVCDGSAKYKVEAEERDFKMGFDGNYALGYYFGTDIKAGVEALIAKGGVTLNDSPASIGEVTQALKGSGTNVTLTLGENDTVTRMELFKTSGILVNEVKKNDDGTITIIGDTSEGQGGGAPGVGGPEGGLPDGFPGGNTPNGMMGNNSDLTFPAANVAEGVEPYTVCVYWDSADGMHIQPADKLTGKLVKSDDHAGVIINIDGKDITFNGADMYQRGASAGNRPGGYANTTDRLDLEEYELTAWLIPGTKGTDNPMIIAFTTGTPERASARLQAAIDYAQKLVDMTVIAESAADAAAKTELKEYHWLKAEDTVVLDGLKKAIEDAKAVLADEDTAAQTVDNTAYNLQIAVWGSNSDVSAVFSGNAKDGYFDKADGGAHALPAAVLF